MNSAYNYKTGKNTMIYNERNSEKGTCRAPAYEGDAFADFTERSLSFIDTIIDFLSSARTLVGAKAVFGFLALLGLLGVIGGIEFGTISLISGVACLAVIAALEFLILRD